MMHLLVFTLSHSMLRCRQRPLLSFVATLYTDNILILAAPLVSINRGGGGVSSSCILDMGPHQLNDPAAVLPRLHLPDDLL